MKISRKYMIYTIIGILMLLATITAVSYAFMSTNQTQEESNIITTLDCMDISIKGTNDSLNLKNAYPITDSQGKSQIPYIFDVTNNCNSYVEYYIVMSVMDTSTLTNEDYIKVQLDGNKNLRPSSLEKLEKDNTLLITENTLNNYVLISDTFNGNETHTYNYRMWLNADSNNIWIDETVKNQNLTVKLSIVGVTLNKPDMLVDTLDTDEDSFFLNGPVKRNEIEKIAFVNHTNISEDSISSWDATNNQNNLIKAWHTLNEETNLYTIYIGQKNGVIANTSSSGLFSNLPNIKEINLKELNTRYTEDMSYMFYETATNNTNNIKLIGIEDLNTSSVRYMTNMFSNIKVENLDLSMWNTSNLNQALGMFEGLEANTINLSNWDTDYIQNMNSMFAYSNIENIRLDNWNTPNALKSNMFLETNLPQNIYVKNETIKNWLSNDTNLTEGINIIVID